VILRLEAEAFIHQVEQPVEADAGPPKRVVEVPHSHILQLSNMDYEQFAGHHRSPAPGPTRRPAAGEVGKLEYFSRGRLRKFFQGDL
jgi:hypothetical protein